MLGKKVDDVNRFNFACPTCEKTDPVLIWSSNQWMQVSLQTFGVCHWKVGIAPVFPKQ
jgi:hypothetical protein